MNNDRQKVGKHLMKIFVNRINNGPIALLIIFLKPISNIQISTYINARFECLNNGALVPYNGILQLNCSPLSHYSRQWLNYKYIV